MTCNNSDLNNGPNDEKNMDNTNTEGSTNSGECKQMQSNIGTVIILPTIRQC